MINQLKIGLLTAITLLSTISLAIEVPKDKLLKLKESAQSKMDSEKYTEAIKEYTKAIELDSKDESLYEGRCLAKTNLERYKEAIKDCDSAIKLNPDGGTVYFVRGSINRSLKKNKIAIEDYSKAIKSKDLPQSVLINSYSGRAGAKKDMGDNYGAIKDYDEVTKLKPKKALTYFLRGAIYFKMGKREAAKEEWSKAGDLGYTDAYDYIKQMGED